MAHGSEARDQDPLDRLFFAGYGTRSSDRRSSTSEALRCIPDQARPVGAPGALRLITNPIGFVARLEGGQFLAAPDLEQYIFNAGDKNSPQPLLPHARAMRRPGVGL